MSESADIQARISEIDCTLNHIGFSGSSSVLSPNCGAIQRDRAEILAALTSERAALLSRLPQTPTGEAWGHIVIAQTLGTVTVRASEPEYHITQRELDLCSDDPFVRFAAQQGEDICSHW